MKLYRDKKYIAIRGIWQALSYDGCGERINIRLLCNEEKPWYPNVLDEYKLLTN